MIIHDIHRDIELPCKTASFDLPSTDTDLQAGSDYIDFVIVCWLSSQSYLNEQFLISSSVLHRG